MIMIIRRTIGIGILILFGMAGWCLAGWFDWESRQIIVVKGTSSVADSTERAYATKLARQTDDWLNELGLRHRLLDDDDITPWSVLGAHAIILPYNPRLSALELKAFKSLIRKGGILIACYGMDSNLATLMEVKLGTYRKAASPRAWNAFSFDQTALPGLPPFVRQSSDHLVPVYPDSGAAQIIAYWTDGRGNPTLEPAWVKTPEGFWMSHVLLPGDEENTKRMLLAMLAFAIPDVWETATAHLLSPHRPFGDYDTLKAAQQELGWIARPPTLHGPAAYEAALAARNVLTFHYAHRPTTSPPPATRGIWVDGVSETWPQMERSLQSHGINIVFFHVGNPLTIGGLPTTLPTHEASPLALHAWLTCLNVEDATETQLSPLRKAKRLQVSDTGETLPWLCPSHPANRKLLADTVAALAKNPIFTGIHLDYIRYNNIHACYCEGCRRRFELGLGHAIERWPKDVITGGSANIYRHWRADQVTACVIAAGDAIRAATPSLKVSAAVYAATPSCFSTVGQDWPRWINQEILDFVCPMNYTVDLDAYRDLLTTQASLHNANRIIPAVGVASSLSRLTADQTVAEIRLIQRTGFPGFVIFELTPRVETDVLPYIRGESWLPNGQH